jgi:putative tricarboxylic transport membrane protein
VLGDKTEDAFRQSMIFSDGSLGIFWSNWLVGSITTIALVLGAWPMLQALWRVIGARRSAPAETRS